MSLDLILINIAVDLQISEVICKNFSNFSAKSSFSTAIKNQLAFTVLM